MKLVVISGVSGSGKTTALRLLEDLDFYCIDNLPVRLLPAFAEHMRSLPGDLGRTAAAGVDARNLASDLKEFPGILAQLRAQRIDSEIIFIDAADEVLIKRFSETRRSHPLTDENTPLADAIIAERKLLEPIASRADLYIDTTHTNIHQLRETVRQRITGITEGSPSILFESFGYKHGVPADADFVFDIRCLPNPHWEAHLQPLTGHDEAVVKYLEAQTMTEPLYQDIRNFLERWIPAHAAENRSYITIAIGCTGGQHRSVYFAKRLADAFAQQYPNVMTRHRDLK